MKELAEKRYEQILKRSFKSDLDLFLFENIFLGITKDKISKEAYVNFVRNEELEGVYSLAWQLSKYEDKIEFKGQELTVKQIDDFYNECYKDKKALDEYKEIFISSRFINSVDFCSFYNNEGIEKSCHYCGITESKIEDLIKSRKIHTKRLLMRGRTLEVDKKNPNGKYDKENMVLCCYWCNNAKTDEFSHDEFMQIGKVIKEIWEKRI